MVNAQGAGQAMNKGMLFYFGVAALIFGAGTVFGQLMPGEWSIGYVGLLAVTADLGTICAAVAALYALSAWRRQIRSQKAYEALSGLLDAFRDRDLINSFLMSVAETEADQRRTAYDISIVERDVRRCVSELSVLGYGICGDQLKNAASKLSTDLQPFSAGKEGNGSPALSLIYGLSPVINRFTAEIYRLQKEVFRSGVW